MPNSINARKRYCILCGISGIAGVAMLMISFSINVGPPLGSSSAEFVKFVQESYKLILWGAWLQAVGPVFIVLFAFALVQLAGAGARLAGWMTFFGATVLMIVNLIEIVFYISALFTTPAVTTAISFELIYSVQHLYFIIATPALFAPLGIVLLGSQVLPRTFGFLALGVAGCFALVGMASLLTLTLPASITALGTIQALWWVAAAVTLLVRSNRIARKNGSINGAS